MRSLAAQISDLVAGPTVRLDPVAGVHEVLTRPDTNRFVVLGVEWGLACPNCAVILHCENDGLAELIAVAWSHDCEVK